MINGGLLSMGSSPYRVCTISMTQGGGHGGLLLDCDGIFSWGGVVEASVFMVAVGQLSLWAANRDPTGWAPLLQLWLWLHSCRMGSISLGELTSIQLDGAMATKTPTSINKTSSSITCWSSVTLFARQQGCPGIGGWASSAQYCNVLM